MIIGITIVVSLIVLQVAYIIGFALGARWDAKRIGNAIKDSELPEDLKLRIFEVLLKDLKKEKSHYEAD